MHICEIRIPTAPNFLFFEIILHLRARTQENSQVSKHNLYTKN